jgi:hypothetical protein
MSFGSSSRGSRCQGCKQGRDDKYDAHDVGGRAVRRSGSLVSVGLKFCWMLGWLMGGETDDKKRDASGRPMGFCRSC